jgi:hypothetical protein
MKFLSINARAIRHSPEHRILSADDVYAAHQRSSCGASLLVLRLCKPDGTFTDPLIVVAGPMAHTSQRRGLRPSRYPLSRTHGRPPQHKRDSALSRQRGSYSHIGGRRPSNSH